MHRFAHYLLDCFSQGPDEPGITSKFTDVLAKSGMNIERLETTVKHDSNGEPIFHIMCDATAPPSVDVEKVKEKMKHLNVKATFDDRAVLSDLQK